MNDMPGLTVKSVITPSKTVPGGADVTLVTDRKHIDAYASYDNYGTRYLGPQQVTGNIAFNSGFLPGDSNAFRVVTVPRTSQMQFYEFVHTQLTGVSGSRVSVGANYSYTHPGFDLTDLDVYGNSTFAFLDYAYPIWRTRTKNLFVHAAANYQNVNSTILSAPFYDDRIRSLIIGGTIDGVDRW
jgi:hemolysin activation/secretion protein